MTLLFRMSPVLRRKSNVFSGDYAASGRISLRVDVLYIDVRSPAYEKTYSSP